jgi:hypothetical protein
MFFLLFYPAPDGCWQVLGIKGKKGKFFDVFEICQKLN